MFSVMIDDTELYMRQSVCVCVCVCICLDINHRVNDEVSTRTKGQSNLSVPKLQRHFSSPLLMARDKEESVTSTCETQYDIHCLLACA